MTEAQVFKISPNYGINFMYDKVKFDGLSVMCNGKTYIHNDNIELRNLSITGEFNMDFAYEWKRHSIAIGGGFIQQEDSMGSNNVEFSENNYTSTYSIYSNVKYNGYMMKAFYDYKFLIFNKPLFGKKIQSSVSFSLGAMSYYYTDYTMDLFFVPEDASSSLGNCSEVEIENYYQNKYPNNSQTRLIYGFTFSYYIFQLGAYTTQLISPVNTINNKFSFYVTLKANLYFYKKFNSGIYEN